MKLNNFDIAVNWKLGQKLDKAKHGIIEEHFPFGLERELGLRFLREKNPFWFLSLYGFGYLCSRKGEEKEAWV